MLRSFTCWGVSTPFPEEHRVRALSANLAYRKFFPKTMPQPPGSQFRVHCDDTDVTWVFTTSDKPNGWIRVSPEGAAAERQKLPPSIHNW